ncbi:tyrosine-type recombinase/integrase [Halococcus sp. PRR34]|uniref:tyrosine-type recombinase/integrase n=1 Tax=Halococcus sp. PRR34 TaxID=3020830 RepID=UPI00235ECBAA|nr:tyrosine-type recombinase/integrase [Halococcus sp. PRR34]
MATTEYEPSKHVERFLKRQEQMKAETTAKGRRSDMKHFERWVNQNDGVDDVTAVESLDIEDFVFAQSQDGYANGTINNRYYSVKKFYAFLDDKLDIIDETPFEGVDRSDLGNMMNGTKKAEATREEISYLSREQVDELADNVPEPRLRNELMVRLMFQTGCRQGELVGIRLEDIDRDDRSIRIHATKTDTNRTVYYQPDIDFLMNQWIDGGYRSSSMYAAESPYLFCSRQSEQFTDHKVNWVVKEAADEAGIQSSMYEDAGGLKRNKITSHVLRHSHAVAALTRPNKKDVRTVQKHLGHADISMTQRYLDITDDDVRNEYERGL